MTETLLEVLRQQREADKLMAAMGRAIAPQVNEWLDRASEKMIENVRRGLEDWCPGCGEKAMLCPDLCEKCAGLNADHTQERES